MDEQAVRYRKYTEEFKLEALELLKSSGKNSRQIERELGITARMLLKWRDRYQVISKIKSSFIWRRATWKLPEPKSGACSMNWQRCRRNATS